MVPSKAGSDPPQIDEDNHLTTSQKRRHRRKRLQVVLTTPNKVKNKVVLYDNSQVPNVGSSGVLSIPIDNAPIDRAKVIRNNIIMEKVKQEILDVREAMRLADFLTGASTQENTNTPVNEKKKDKAGKRTSKTVVKQSIDVPVKTPQANTESPKGKDEVDKAILKPETSAVSDKSKDQIKAERAAKKAAKQAKKKGEESGDAANKATVKTGDAAIKSTDVALKSANVPIKSGDDNKSGEKAKEVGDPAKKSGEMSKKSVDVGKKSVDLVNNEMTVKDVVETLKDIANVAKEVKDVTAKVQAINLEPKQPQPADATGKSKAELRAERRAKQEAQRAIKQAAEQKIKPKEPPPKTAKVEEAPAKKEGTPTKAKSVERTRPKAAQRVNWFQHLATEHDKDFLKNVPLNSNLHPAIIKLGVQLATKVVSGSNARCIALLDALRKMVTEYSLPARTEYGRGLEAQLAASLALLWAARPPCAAQASALKYFRRQLTLLPNNVPEYDAKKKLQDAIDSYIHDQIDTAGEAISMAVRNKILPGDTILTYGCSSLIERILCEAWAARPQFRTVVAGNRVHGGGPEMLRRLAARGLPCTYCDITAVSFLMKNVNKVLLGASALMVNGAVLGAVGTAQVALVARTYNVPVLVACETHKFSDRVQTDAFVYNELGDPDDLIDKSDENSPLKDWRSNPNLTPLNITYDVTPPNLVTAVVTELAILPCTSAPVVLRTKMAEHGI